MNFEKVSVEALNENFIKSIGSEWMLVTAGNSEKFNTMTASWGFTGFMWGKPCAVAAVRPQRYTFEFIEREDFYTLSFYGENKKIHSVCGNKSGKNINKVKEAGLTPLFDLDTGAPYFEEARLVLICKKLYVSDLKKENFTKEEIPLEFYAENDYHRIFCGEIVSALVKK